MDDGDVIRGVLSINDIVRQEARHANGSNEVIAPLAAIGTPREARRRPCSAGVMQITRRRSAPATNGYARAAKRIEDALGNAGSSGAHITLTRIDEEELRDCVEQQLGIAGVCAARASTAAWRRFLIAHFQRLGVVVAFDGTALSAVAVHAAARGANDEANRHRDKSSERSRHA